MLHDQPVNDAPVVALPATENEPSSPQQNNPSPPKNNYGCTLAAILLPALTVCLFVSWFFGYIDNAERFVRSFSFPAIQARFKPVADQLAAVTSDTLIDSKPSISNAVLLTHSNYTGTVLGYYEMIFGTNRPYDDALSDYVRYLQAMPDWTVNSGAGSYTSAHNSENTEELSIKLADKGVGDPKKYRTIYEVTLYFGDPDLWD